MKTPLHSTPKKRGPHCPTTCTACVQDHWHNLQIKPQPKLNFSKKWDWKSKRMLAVTRGVRVLSPTPPQDGFNEENPPPTPKRKRMVTWRAKTLSVLHTERMTAPDSPDQSSNAPLIAQDSRRPAVTLSLSLISYQTHTSNKCVTPPPQPRITGKTMTYEDVVASWKIPLKWAEPWGLAMERISMNERGSWGSHISCWEGGGSKGNFRAWCDEDRWCWKLVCACVCTIAGGTYKTPALFIFKCSQLGFHKNFHPARGQYKKIELKT